MPANLNSNQSYTTLIEKIIRSLPTSISVNTTSDWLNFSNSSVILPSQGWKIHVTTTLLEFSNLVDQVIIPLLQQKVNFKIPKDQSTLLRLNAGDCGSSQVGKILTIYPTTQVDFLKLLEWLSECWPNSHGPRVPNEPTFRPNGPVSCRYGDFTGQFKLNSHGRPIRIVTENDGTTIEDTIDNTHKKILELPFKLYQFIPITSKLLTDLENDFHFIDRIKNASTRVILAMHKVTFEMVYIKHAFQGELADSRSTDKYQQILKEFDILTKLNDYSFACPEVFAFQKTESEALLIIRKIDGEVLNSENYRKFQLKNPLITLINRLHKHGIAHNDIKETNIIINNSGQPSLIDFGASGYLGDQQTNSQATQGYFLRPSSNPIMTEESDLFAINSVLFSMETGCSPSNLIATPNRLLFLAENNPKSNSTNNELFSDFVKTKFEPQNLSADKVFNACLDYFDFDTGAWANKHYFSTFKLDSVNTGSAGILLGLLKMRPHINQVNNLDAVVLKTVERLNSMQPFDEAHGLFGGNSGIAVILALCAVVYDMPSLRNSIRNRLDRSFRNAVEMDFFNGLAGIIYAAIIVDTIFGEKFFEPMIVEYSQILLDQFTIKNGILGVPSNDNGEIETGLAHGAAGMGFVIFHIGKYLDASYLVELSYHIFNSIFHNASTDRFIYFDTTKNKSTPNMIWCRGIAGQLWAILNTFGTTEPRLSNQLEILSDLYRDSVGIHNPTLCHGMAGQLELLQLMKSKTPSPKTHYKLDKVKACLKSMLIEVDQKQFFLSEDQNKVSPDYWVGFTGTASTLLTIDSQNFNPSITIDDFLSIIANNNILFNQKTTTAK